MIFLSLLTAGYVLGVVTALVVFPPGTKELEEQEMV